MSKKIFIFILIAAIVKLFYVSCVAAINMWLDISPSAAFDIGSVLPEHQVFSCKNIPDKNIFQDYRYSISVLDKKADNKDKLSDLKAYRLLAVSLGRYPRAILKKVNKDGVIFVEEGGCLLADVVVKKVQCKSIVFSTPYGEYNLCIE